MEQFDNKQKGKKYGGSNILKESIHMVNNFQFEVGKEPNLVSIKEDSGTGEISILFPSERLVFDDFQQFQVLMFQLTPMVDSFFVDLASKAKALAEPAGKSSDAPEPEFRVDVDRGGEIYMECPTEMVSFADGRELREFLWDLEARVMKKWKDLEALEFELDEEWMMLNEDDQMMKKSKDLEALEFELDEEWMMLEDDQNGN